MPVELIFLLLGEFQGEQSFLLQLVPAGLPFVSHPDELCFHVQFIFAELVFPFAYTGHVIEYVSRELSVLRRGDERLYLCGRAREEYGQVTGGGFLVFPVCAAVVGQAVVVERLAQRVAPVAEFRPYGRRYGVRLALADNPRSVRVYQVLQQSRARVVAGDDEHAVGRRHGRLLVLACLPQRFVGS